MRKNVRLASTAVHSKEDRFWDEYEFFEKAEQRSRLDKEDCLGV